MNPDIRFNQLLVNLDVTDDLSLPDGYYHEINYNEEPSITLSKILKNKKGV